MAPLEGYIADVAQLQFFTVARVASWNEYTRRKVTKRGARGVRPKAKLKAGACGCALGVGLKGAKLDGCVVQRHVLPTRHDVHSARDKILNKVAVNG